MRERNANDYFEMSLREISEEDGTSIDNIKEIERRALLKLKKALEKHGYKASDFLGGMA
jgi:DNA-directed RNA polymerase specialized sigma24 family protein